LIDAYGHHIPPEEGTEMTPAIGSSVIIDITVRFKLKVSFLIVCKASYFVKDYPLSSFKLITDQRNKFLNLISGITII
jgi:hypothetical protein